MPNCPSPATHSWRHLDHWATAYLDALDLRHGGQDPKGLPPDSASRLAWDLVPSDTPEGETVPARLERAERERRERAAERLSSAAQVGTDHANRTEPDEFGSLRCAGCHGDYFVSEGHRCAVSGFSRNAAPTSPVEKREAMAPGDLDPWGLAGAPTLELNDFSPLNKKAGNEMGVQTSVPGSGLANELTTETEKAGPPPEAALLAPKKRGRPPKNPGGIAGSSSAARPVSQMVPGASPGGLTLPARASALVATANGELTEAQAKDFKALGKTAAVVADTLLGFSPARRLVVLKLAFAGLAASDAQRRIANELAGRSADHPFYEPELHRPGVVDRGRALRDSLRALVYEFEHDLAADWF